MDKDMTLRIAGTQAATLFAENMIDDEVEVVEFLLIAGRFTEWLAAHDDETRAVALEALNAAVVVTGRSGSKSIRDAVEKADKIRHFLMTGTNER